MKVERRSLSPRSSKAAVDSSRTSRTLRILMFTFAVGLLIGQCAKSKSTVAKQIASFDLKSKADTYITNEKKINRSKLERVKEKYGPVRNIALLGERNSGTTWMTEELQRCFESQGVEVRSGLTRDKHFFQYDEDYAEGDPSYYRHYNAVTDVKLERKSTLVVSVFRSAYAWSAAMQRRPHHSPNHLRLPMEEFLTRPWTMERPERDFVYANVEDHKCQLGYSYDQIIPCVRTKHDDVEREGNLPNYSARDPEYELRQDGSGEPYDSILALRQAKIENIMSLEEWDWVASSETLRYEDLLKYGTEPFLKYVEQITGTKMQCTPSPAAPERVSKYQLEPKIKKLIDDKLDWEIEALIGYERE